MADEKISQTPAITTLTNDDLFVVVNDPAGTPVTNKITVANVKTVLQPYDADLAAIAAIAPANDDIIQRKAGAWTNRTMAQLNADLAALLTWTTFTPTFTQTATITKTVGYARYLQVGKTVYCNYVMTATSAGTASAAVATGLPVAAASTSAFLVIGNAFIFDSSTNTAYHLAAYAPSTLTVNFLGDNTAGSVFGATPAITIASGDYVSVSLVYEAA